VARLQAGRCGVQIPVGGNRFSSLHNVQTISGAHSVPGYSGQCVKLTAHLNLVPVLTLCRVLYLLPVFAFMACKRRTVVMLVVVMWEECTAVSACL
jgi:hypothetical protein